MKALQIVADAARTKVIRLPQAENLADDVVRRGLRKAMRDAGPITQAGLAMVVEAAFPQATTFLAWDSPFAPY